MENQKFVIVNTEYGPVKGVEKTSALGRDYLNFQGIPYMKAPVGKLRFRDAQPPEKWTEVLDATREPSSYVTVSIMDMTKVTGREDASIINVYTHDVSPVKPKAVLVWIHGGGFQAGSSCTDSYGPDYILQKDVILVSFNYRCGVFGFLSLDDPELNIPGNAGLKDQTFALKWVQRNIKNFGGDPGNVTIFGESVRRSEKLRGIFLISNDFWF
jgi:cholinesterase